VLSAELFESRQLLWFIVDPLLIPVYEQFLDERETLELRASLFYDFTDKGLLGTLARVHTTPWQLYI